MIAELLLAGGRRAQLDRMGMWQAEEPELRAALRLLYDPGRYGPADGEPLRVAVVDAAAGLRATIAWGADVPAGGPPGRIY